MAMLSWKTLITYKTFQVEECLILTRRQKIQDSVVSVETDTPISPASLWHSRLQQAASLLLWIWVGFAMLQSGSQEATDTNGALVGWWQRKPSRQTFTFNDLQTQSRDQRPSVKSMFFSVSHRQAGNCTFLSNVYTPARTNLIVAGNSLDWAEWSR